MSQQRVWTLLNQPFTIWALTVLSVLMFVATWQPRQLEMERIAQARAEHERLHTEVKSRLRELSSQVRDRVSLPEMRRSLDSGAAANIHRELDTRSLRSLAMEHDELVASGRVHCPVPFLKGTESIYEALRSAGMETPSAAKTGIDSLLAQLGGGSTN